MANEIKMTEVQALRNALAGILDEETTAKLEHMIEVRSRKRERKTDNSKTLENQALGARFEELWDGGTFKASDVKDTLGISVAKACAVAKTMGWETVPTTERVNVYTL